MACVNCDATDNCTCELEESVNSNSPCDNCRFECMRDEACPFQSYFDEQDDVHIPEPDTCCVCGNEGSIGDDGHCANEDCINAFCEALNAEAPF